MEINHEPEHDRLTEHEEQMRHFDGPEPRDPVPLERLQDLERSLDEEIHQVESEPDNPERTERLARLVADLTEVQQEIAYRNGIEPGAVFL